jgi:hypothetical protein
MFFIEVERPLSEKADVQDIVFEKSLGNDRYTLDSGHSGDTMAGDR